MNEFDLTTDTDGLATYDYIVNHLPDADADMDRLTAGLMERDKTGKYMASAVKFLVSHDKDRYRDSIYKLIEGTIRKDREHRYIGSLLEAVWGKDYNERVEELNKTDDNFRRIYKRVYPGNQV